jgi:hypothetical protein
MELKLENYILSRTLNCPPSLGFESQYRATLFLDGVLVK